MTKHLSQSTGRILAGYGVDGSAHYVPVPLDEGTEICRECEGIGQLHYTVARDGFERRESCQCHECDGEGIIYSHTDHEEE